MNVISCSRRTDIPRCHPDWLDSCLKSREAVFTAPRGAIRRVSLQSGDVHSLVLWSKDYAPVLERATLMERLAELNPFFHFTVTGLGGTALEPGVPAWEAAVKTMGRLVERFGSQRINWRFDPVVHWRGRGGQVRSNLDLFTRIGEETTALGIGTCTFSFAHWYRKSSLRARRAGLDFEVLSADEQVAIAGGLAGKARRLGIALTSCSSELLEEVDGVAKARCVDHEKLTSLRADLLPASSARDRSQRDQCGCSLSIDIGSYSQSCGNAACIYCYAN